MKIESLSYGLTEVSRGDLIRRHYALGGAC